MGVHSGPQERPSIPTGADPATVADILTAAADLIAKPGAWTQVAAARDKEGHSVPVTSDRACSWCLYGSVTRFAGDDGELFDAAWAALKAGPAGGSPISFSEEKGRKQRDVVAALRAAAEKARTDAEAVHLRKRLLRRLR